MCCFSRPVVSVHDTRIFARMARGGVQYVIYQMDLETEEDLAMVLPLPTEREAGARALKFVDLSAYPTLFADMRKPFPAEGGRDPFGAADPFADLTPAKPKIVVQRIGAYDASFVPSAADFDRLDERFRLPVDTWEALPDYANYGFAVFKLRAGKSRPHPMAFAFRSTQPGMLFFPTVHIHDGEIHEKAAFDHEIYLQGGFPKAMTRLADAEAAQQNIWQETNQLPSQFMKMNKTQGTIVPNAHIYRLTIRGEFLNRDVFVRAG